MKQRQSLLGQNLIVFTLFCFLIFVFTKHRVLVSSEELPAISQEQYIVHFLSTVETQNILLQKCCQQSEVLNKDGLCVATPSGFRPVVSIPFEKRFKRALQNVSFVHEEENETIEVNLEENAFTLQWLSYERPSCTKGSLYQKSYNSPDELQSQLTASLELVILDFSSSSFLNSFNYHSLIINTKNYCIDNSESTSGIVVLYCVPENVDNFSPVTTITNQPQGNRIVTPTPSNIMSPSSAHPVLLRKCCPPFHVIDIISISCVKHDIPWQLHPILSSEPMDHDDASYQSDADEMMYENSAHRAKSISLQVSWLTGFPNCDYYDVYIDKYDRYYVNSEGILITEQNGTVAKTPQTEFCIDAVIHNNESESDLGSANNNITAYADTTVFSRQIALVCFDESMEAVGHLDNETNTKFSRWTLYAILTGISSVFLLITCLVYTVLRKELKLPGWLQFAYSIALLVTYTLLTVAQLWTQAIHDISKSLCRALGYGLHFSFLVCFFYLTSMNFEIFSSFRSITLAHGFGKGRGKRRFLEFTAFSIGFPFAVIVLLLAVDSCKPTNSNLEESLCILPTTGIGVESCVFDSRHKVAQLHYFYGFVGILLMINLVIFVCTLVSLRNRERETRLAKRQSTSTCDYDRLQLFTRLFLIMGILWIFEVISWLFQYFDVDEKIQDIFIVTDCLNASQGFAVFLMFVCKRQTWKQLKKKFKARFHRTRPLCRPNFNGTMSSSNNTNGTSVNSSHLSSTKSRDSTRLPSTSTATVVVGIGMLENGVPLRPET